MAKVSIVKTKPETVLSDYEQVMHGTGYQKSFKKSEEILLKLNLSWSLYYPACSTEPWQLEGVLKTLHADGYNHLFPVENKTVVTKPWKGAEDNKWLPVLAKYDHRFISLPDVPWALYKPKTDTPALNELYPHDYKIPRMFVGRNVIHLPTMKCHGHTVMTGAMKNAFGGLITTRRHHSHKIIDEVLVDLLAVQKEIHPKMLAVMDGTVCGDGAGPRTMIPVIKNYLLASEDQVAIDAMAAKMMGFDPMKINFIKMAHDKGLGCGDPDQIDIIGEDISKVNFHFKTKKSIVVYMDQVFRKKYPLFEPILFHTPLFHLCIMGSEFYHDHFWYPLVGKQRIRKFMKTEWGELFKKY